METLANLESFVRSAETGGFSAAARRLSLTPAAVSRNVAMLERNLGIRLFQRSTRRLTLTEAGERFLLAIRGSLDEAIGGGFDLAPGLVSRALAPAHIIAVASPAYLKGRTPPADPSGLASFDGIVMRSSKTRRVRERPMRNAVGDEMPVPLKTTIAFDDPEAMCQAAVLGMGVTQIVMAHALRHLESGALVRLVPQWYADAGPISIYYASRTLMPAKTRVFVDFVAEAFRHQRLAERFAGSIA